MTTTRLAKSFHCPSEFTLEVLGGKWKTVILCFLKQRPCRYGELRKLMPKLSDKVLSQRLADLTGAGLVVRKRRSSEGKMEVYALTTRGKSLSGLLRELYVWGNSHAAEFGVEVHDPLLGLQ
jgi:DNA-binding HxlR family transcriptional regulator